MGKRVVFNDYKEKLQDKSVELEFGDNDVIIVPPLQLWADEQFKAAEKNDPKLLVDALTGGKADYLKMTYGANPVTVLSMIYEGYGITVDDLGKALNSFISSGNMGKN